MSASNGSTKNHPIVADESTPLLASPDAEPTDPTANEQQPRLESSTAQNGNADARDGEDKPLPLTQIFLLCYARLLEPIAFFQIFPFISQMIQDTGNLKEEDVGFYAGLIESLFSLTQMLVMVSWGKASDYFGRKPILVVSLVGMSIFVSFFGFSKAIWQMIVFRCGAGVFAGTVVTIRTMMAENSTAKTQARAFSLFAFFSNFGIFVGPLLGGALADPARQYPSWFGDVEFFKAFPYSLPTLVSGAFGATTVILCAIFVKEANHQQTLKRSSGGESSPNESLSTWELIKYPGVATVLFIYGHVMLMAFGYTAVLPVFAFTKPLLGGFGLSPFQISLFMGLGGLSQALWTLIAFPWLHRRIGTGGILRLCSYALPFFYLSCPICNWFLRRGWSTAFWIVAPANQAVGSGVAMAFTAVQLALNDVAPSYSTLGTLNAIALTLVAALRAVAPALFSSIFATGVTYQVLSGYLVWLVLVLLASVQPFVLRWLPTKAEGLPKTAEQDDETERERVVAAEAAAAAEGDVIE